MSLSLLALPIAAVLAMGQPTSGMRPAAVHETLELTQVIAPDDSNLVYTPPQTQADRQIDRGQLFEAAFVGLVMPAFYLSTLLIRRPLE